MPWYCALACLGEARGKLGTQPSPAPGGDIVYAQRSGVAVAEAGPPSCRRRGGHVVTGVVTDAL
ncbi:hypothetical protein ABT124_26140 [Streptomyces sp. NPDC001982]|uniref:hypothetical protein n=1 Tax=unclassified Streptomyces TaxID=2593676 RepID=UPI003326D445